MNESERPELVAEAIRAVWSSLDSHLEHTNLGVIVGNDTDEFHKRCVREYAALIVLLTKLY